MFLSSAVKLYRAASNPDIDAGTFSGSLEYTPELTQVFETLRSGSLRYFEYLDFDGNEILDEDPLPHSWHHVQFAFRIPTTSSDSFFKSFSDLLKRTPKISRGELPEHFYIIDKNYLHPEDESPPEMNTLTVVCQLIVKMSDLAHYHDGKVPASGYYKLVFIPPGNVHSSSPLVIETKVDETFFPLPIPNISLLNELSCDHSQCDPHISAKIDVFRTSLFEFFKPGSRQAQNAFKYLVKNWDGFIDLFQKNMGTYLSGFAFHKARMEVAEAEFNIAEQFSKVTSEIAGKLLSIPLSFAVVIGIVKSDSFIESILLVVGLLLASVIIVGAVDNQQRQLNRISNAKKIVFDALEGKREIYPKELGNDIDKMKIILDTNEKKLRITLWVYRCVSWIPVIAGLGLLLHYHWK